MSLRWHTLAVHWESRQTRAGKDLPIFKRSRHAPKGQKHKAQGIALGWLTAANAPCKGKSVRIQVFELMLFHKIGCVRHSSSKLGSALTCTIFALAGRTLSLHVTPGRCPGLCARCPFFKCLARLASNSRPLPAIPAPGLCPRSQWARKSPPAFHAGAGCRPHEYPVGLFDYKNF